MDEEDEEGSEGEIEPEYSGMEQPPLTRMLKNILSEYPDDGQILKELIQNAEDAGASEVKIVFDDRCINQEACNEKKKPFNKYFKGPALFFHNNAVFSDSDWRGIKMLYSSVKELDPLKVGRFGLGFKSVFHITDYPMIISGKKLLVINPYTTYTDKVCTSFLLKGLSRYKGMDMNAFSDAFDDIFGFGEETLSSGEYKGTLFRFPLRQVGTELSGNLYDAEKIETLFDSFKTEAPMTLLFLKRLEEMTLYRKNHGVEPIYRVKIEGKGSEKLLEKRKKFCQDLQEYDRSNMSHDLTFSLHVNVSVKTSGQYGLQENNSWFIVNKVLGGSHMSAQFRALSQDKDLSYSPYVGIAIPYKDIADFKGHVFCFLPLPLEERSLTGLPVHLNGFFALSQNRRHVKWPSADLKQSAISADKSLQWNQVMIKEALSNVYLTVVQDLINKCSEANNPVDLVAMVYRSIPHLHKVDVKWRGILDPLLNSLMQTSFLYTENNGGQWIQSKDAVFECPDYVYNNDTEVRDTLRLIMKQYKKNLVIIPPHITALLQEKTNMTVLSPSFLGNLLRQNNLYENCNWNQKLHLLQYLMSDEQYFSLESLKLLPLENGSFTTFENYGCVYMCGESTMKLIPGCEELTVKQDLPHVIKQHLQTIAKKGMFQVQALNNLGFVRLLKLSMDRNLTDNGQFKVWDTKKSSLSVDWLEKVWSKLKAISSLEHFTDLHLVPKKHGKDYHLYKLKGLFIVKSYNSHILPEAVCRSMAHFSVIVLPELPRFMAEHSEVTNYIHIPVQDSFLRLLDRLYTNNYAYLQSFNTNAENEERSSWMKYLEHLNIRKSYGEMPLGQMKIFKEFGNIGYTSISEVDTLAPQLGCDFPVKYPRRLLSSTDSCQCQVAQNLGATQLTEVAAIEIILREKWHTYSDMDKKKLMKYFIRKIHQFKRNYDLMELAKNAEFVPTSTRGLKKPSELYDPNIKRLKELIGDDSMFPEGQFSSPEILVGLRDLGLKSSSPPCELIYSCIDELDTKVRQGKLSNFKQAEAVNHFLSQQSKQLDYYLLRDKRFLVPQKRTSVYPTSLPWYHNTHELCSPGECILGTTRNQRIVGSVIPLVSENAYSYLKDTFQLLHPQITDVLNHLLQIQRSYKVNYKPDMLQCISEVYSFLADNVSTSWDIKGEIQDFFSKEPLVLAGEMFVKVNDVYTTSNPGDIRLDPYMYCLPREFQSFKQFFEIIGCHDKQTVDVLHTVQEKIKVKHDGQTCASSNDVDKDLNITVQILTKYKQDPKSVSHLDVLFPVHTGSDTRLQLMYASECRYSNEEWLKSMAEEEEETIHYVHADIPSHTAHTLGVRSLTEGLLSDTEAIEPCGQHEDLTGRIKGLLDGYTDGLSVPKEIVQNADDAGATKVCFLYDERENMDARTRLIDENMSSFQGAAFWAYNDAQFTKADLNNITKLGGATKQEDDTKIGKFGLGFCSVYNLTDVPSFITGTDLVIFDPHYRNLGSAVKGKEPGLKINLKSLQNQRLVRRMKNQFKPFNKVFGCDMTMGGDFHSYDGTLFRLPLRTNEHAGKSQIKDSAYSKSDIKELLHMLMENGGNMLLFTQNVTKIEVYYLPADATDPSQSTRIYTATKNMRDCDFQNIQVAGTFNILKEVSALNSSVQHRQKHVPEVKKTIQTEINIQVENAAKCFISCTVSEMQSSTQWVITYATGSSKSLEISKQVKGVLPLAGVATPVQINGSVVKLTSLGNMPFGFYKTGHYFSFLPLPIQTGLPFHINATFAVAPDRRSIMWGTEDDKTIFFKPRWNHSLMIDAVPKAYVCLLESLQTFSGIIDEDYINIWPTGIYPASSKELQHLQKAFLTTIVEENHRVFKRCDIWANYEDCRFVDPELLESEVGDIAFEAAIHFLETVGGESTKVMKLQKNLDASFRNAGLGSTIGTKIFSTENFFTEVLFPEMLSDFWQSRERNMLVMFAIDNMIETTKTLLQSTKCIPVEPTGELKCPHDLIHPESELKNLFTTCEGRFVHKEMIDIGIKQRKKQMEDIGMIVETLPSQLVVDRVKSVLVLSQACDMCALERSFTIIKYIERKCMQDKMLIEQLKDIPYLPVLKKPKDWSFLWGADRQSSDTDLTTMKDVKVTNCNHNVKESVQFARPRCLYLTSTQHLVGSQELVMDKSYCESLLFREIFSKLGVNGGNVDTIPIKVVCRHLIELCENTDLVKMTEDSKHLLKKVCNEVYTFLNKRIIYETISEEEMIYIKDLKEHPIVFCHNVFVKPKQTALNILVDCEPHLFGLLSHHLGSKCKQLLQVLDIKNQFTSDDILNVMLERQTYIGAKHLTEDELELYTKLIKVLVRCMKQENIDYHRICTITDKEGVSTQLCIPDVEGVLTPIKLMCLNDNEEIKTTGTMKFVNGKIGPDFARTLGVKAKTKQHFSDNTRKIPFGQKEELTTRIKEILRDYPCDEGIMKELLQNADDAQATELQFIIDDNTYSTERVFDDRWKTLQGPALLVYNDSMFSNKDIQGIQNLGIGSKGDDPTKTGQYGVGFNAVYHLTDAPSFLSKGPNVEEGATMCVMDPYCQYLPDATEERPGIQLLNLDEHRNLHPDVFTCYHEDKLLTDKGTVFRFPLRSDDETKKHLAVPMSSKKLRDLFKTFEGELLETLLFVNSVKKISLSDFSDGELKPLYEVEIVISEEDERKRIAFGNHLKDMNKKYSDTQDLSSIQNESVSYNITVKDSHGVSNTWLVVQQIGFGDGDIPEEVLNAYKNGNLGLLPRGGVAIHLASHTLSEQRQKTVCHTSQTSSKQKCKAFCFLPLPIDTGLPVHVNGHFALGGDTRSSLWTEERRTYRWEWNKLLLSRIIPSAYITGMQRIKHMLLSDFGKSGLVITTQQLDDVFPVYKNAKDDNWKLVAKEVLTQIYNDGHQLFYLYESHKNSDTIKIPPVFMALKDPKEEFPAVFNTLEDHKKKTTERLTWKNRQLLTQVMKDIGLRLLDSHKKILRSMKDAEVPVSEISPETVMEFTKSFSRKDIEHRCNILIQEDGTHLSNTNLQSLGNILALLQYCRDSDDFASGIVDVPLCLTQDGKLRVFKEDSEIFCSEQLSILPGSGNRFLHSSLVWLCNIEQLKKKVFKLFDIPSFAKYLAESLPPEVFMKPKEMVTFLPESKQIPNSLWICNVWKFFEGCLKKSKGKDEAIKRKDEANKTSPDDNEAIQTIPKDLQVVAHWNLVPCTLFETTQKCETKRKVLSSLSNFDKVLDLESFTRNLKNALEKLAVPVFATDLLDSSVLLSLIPNHKRPVMVLNCLYLNRNQSRYQSLSETNSDAILEYFVDHIKDIERLDDWKTKLKSLPLHCTVHGVLVSLEIERKVLVLPAHIPPEGIKEWGHYSRTLLLKQNPKLKPLYDAFEYTESHLCDVYSNHILASIDGLPKDCIPVHLEYIRGKLLQSYDNSYDIHQGNLIAALKELRIFETAGGGLKRASELYSPHVPLFLAMCNIFPVAPYDKSKWKSFMELIGMVAKASNDLIIQFAHQIEAEGRYAITERVLEKSEYLLKYIWEIDNVAGSGLLPRIRTIKFIVPSKISWKQETIYPQYEAGQLMVFEGAVPDFYTKYVWSSSNILPEMANPFLGFNKKKTDAIARQLHVCLEKPPLEKVILHTQNICDALKEQCEKKIWQNKDEYLKRLMSDIYQHLWQNGAKQDILYSHLHQKPIVYLPSENKFVTCGVLVIHLEEEQEIKPYLYSAPLEFGGNFELFEKLGTEKRPTCAVYARVLERVKCDVMDQELNANERQSVLKAIIGLFSHLPMSNNIDVKLQVPVLYLPAEDYKLMDSTKMIYSNNQHLHKAIGNEAGLPYFVGFQALELFFNEMNIEKIPAKYRPCILTKMVKERIVISSQQVTQGYYTNQLQEFIQRPEFVEGLLRISHHHRYESFLQGPGNVDESDVVSGLQRVKVLQVEDLTVEYIYNGRVVGSSTDVFCHIHKEDNDQESVAWYFYTKVPEGMDKTLWLRKIEKKLIKLIKKSTKIDCFHHGSLMLNILMEIDHPERISVILDQEHYHEYRLHESLLNTFLPPCGTYVHEKWHHMLDNTTFSFDNDEYVALQLYDDEVMNSDASTEESDLYIYAKIMKRIGCDIEGDLSPELTKYEVLVGEGRLIIKYAYEMYKILRKKTDSREIVQAVDIGNQSPTNTLPLQVNYKEVRRKLLAIWNLPDREKKAIFKRYLRQWHPDKNIGNEAKAKDVFQYIMNIWDRLTNGDHVSVDDDDFDTSDCFQSRPSPNSQFYENVSRQCSRERERYQESTSSTSRGGYRRSHFHDNDPVSNPMQQRKCFKQAELDLVAAEHFMKSIEYEEVRAYNWICYMSHQAVEKSLKSMMYRRDANSVYTKGHDIYGIATSLCDDSLISATMEMHSLLGNHTHMRYPDEHACGMIPSSFFTRAMAEKALEIARRVLDEVDEKS